MHQEKKMLAHISEDGTRVQTVADHLQGTAVLCGQFAAAFDAQQQGTWLGLLHDIGKYSTKFQKRLQGGEKVDHSTAGAQVAARYGQIPLAFAIAGHHSGLPDGGGRSDTAQDATMFGRLKKAGYEKLIVTCNGQEAWDKIQEFEKAGTLDENVHCVITDIEMPQMDGHRLTKLIKSDDKLKHLPVIIFSSLVNEEMRRKGESLGADAQLTKPEIGSLVDAIDELLAKRNK